MVSVVHILCKQLFTTLVNISDFLDQKFDLRTHVTESPKQDIMAATQTRAEFFYGVSFFLGIREECQKKLSTVFG